jgi:hypothetical protein
MMNHGLPLTPISHLSNVFHTGTLSDMSFQTAWTPLRNALMSKVESIARYLA